MLTGGGRSAGFEAPLRPSTFDGLFECKVTEWRVFSIQENSNSFRSCPAREAGALLPHPLPEYCGRAAFNSDRPRREVGVAVTGLVTPHRIGFEQ